MILKGSERGGAKALAIHLLRTDTNDHVEVHEVRGFVSDDVEEANLPHFKRKLNDLGRELYIQHGWNLPRGFLRLEDRNPLNYSLVEWQQSKRLGRDTAELKAMFQALWARSDSRKAFEAALESRGFYLAQGNRRGYVAIDVKGMVYSLSRWCGVHVRDLGARLGDPAKLPTIESLKPKLTEALTEKLKGFGREIAGAFQAASDAIAAKRNCLVAHQRANRSDMRDRQAIRWHLESAARLARFRKGLVGLWDRITGMHRSTLLLNEREAVAALARDRAEREVVVRQQLSERRSLNAEAKVVRAQGVDQSQRLEAEISQIQTQSDEPAKSPEVDAPRGPNRKNNRTQTTTRRRQL